MSKTYVRLTLDLDPDLNERLRLEAGKLGISKSANIRRRLTAPLRLDPKTYHLPSKREKRAQREGG